jgi:pimeloyl-ACP methyl ester carboxylesterase
MKNFVLVHGSWAGGTVWHKLAPLLAGHRVFAPTLSGFHVGEIAAPEMGLRRHIDEIILLCEHEDLHDVVLVGHSYGGMVIQGVAERVPYRIATLVFLDAFIPEHDQCLFDLLPEKSAQGMRARLTDATGRTHAEGATEAWLIPPPPSLDGWKVFGDDAVWLTTQLTPTAVSTFEERVSLSDPAARTLPRRFVRCTGFPTFADTEAKVQQAGWPIDRLECGHFAQLDVPEQLAAILVAVGQPAR